jgi:hypothetical protein
MAQAYYTIASTRLTGNQSSITLGSIPSTYKHLELRLKVRGQTGEPAGTGSGVVFYFNTAAGGTIYPRQNYWTWGTNPVASYLDNSDNMTLIQYMRGGGPANYSNGMVVSILNYKETNKGKIVRAFGGVAGNQAAANQNNSASGGAGGYWKASAGNAITSITITPDQAGFGAGTTFSIYGIKDS